MLITKLKEKHVNKKT